MREGADKDNLTKEDIEIRPFEDVISEIESNYEQQLDSLKQDFDETKTELSDLRTRKILNEERYRRLSMKFGYLFEGQIGAEAVRKLLQDIDLPKIVS